MHTMKSSIKTICLFCGSSNGINSLYSDAAILFGQSLVKNNLDLVYGGGGRGLMGLVANEVKNGGNKVTGIIPKKIYEMVKDIPHNEDQLIVVDDMHQRKAKMYSLSDAFVALPGGIGTLEETLEIFTWLQLGYHQKPVALLNTNNFFDPLVDLFNHMVDQGFLNKTFVKNLIVEKEDDILIEKLFFTDLKLFNKY